MENEPAWSKYAVIQDELFNFCVTKPKINVPEVC